MRKITCCLSCFILFFLASRAFADFSSNADFNPFPQMEQDQKNADDDMASDPHQENDDSQQVNSEVNHE